MNDTNKISCAIITGGGRGLGRAIATRLALDRPVILVGRDNTALLDTKRLIETRGGRAEVVCGDVREGQTIADCEAAIAKLSWQVDLLICNAGVGKSGVTHEISDETWEDIVSTNLTSVHRWCDTFCPAMLVRNRGTVCLISSVAGLKGVAYDSAYAASKHALVGLGRSMALEYGKNGVAVQIVCPGYIDGEMTARSISALASRKNIPKSEARALIAKQSPMREIMSPDDVAEIVAFLCTKPGALLAGNPIVLGASA